ncbi:hypothetical protein FGB62_25g47 [Gracilaria domingensis]|nr:hypothetical protein FGB62_25g47 [Gracilaria domingensis]
MLLRVHDMEEDRIPLSSSYSEIKEISCSLAIAVGKKPMLRWMNGELPEPRYKLSVISQLMPSREEVELAGVVACDRHCKKSNSLGGLLKQLRRPPCATRE